MVALPIKNGWKQDRRDQQQRERGDDHGREPRGDIVDGAVNEGSHHLTIIDEAQDGDENHGKEQTVDDLCDDEHADQRQPRDHRHERADSDQKREDADKDWRFAETP